MVRNPPTAFYAYPDKPSDLEETLEGAINEINRSQLIRITSWRSLQTTGKVLIDTILQEIGDSDIFACDLTYINHNVLFELGYAIGTNKRIWITLNTTIKNAARNYKRLTTTLASVGYASYANKRDIVQHFYDEQPWEKSVSPSLGHTNTERISTKPPRTPTLLFLKSSIPTDSSIALDRLSEKVQPFGDRIVDDPNEIPFIGRQWYLENTRRADAIIAHLISDDHQGKEWHNAKCSFVCGLALGMGKHVFMLAHEPFAPPFDYQDLLRTHNKASDCEQLAHEWFNHIRPSITSHWRSIASFKEDQESSLALQQLSAGQSLAENEYNVADSYFVLTSAYREALSGSTAIFVGRRGTGKTANLYALERELRRDKRNHVCVIKPVEYEVDGIVRVLKQSIARSEKGFLVESLWKFLIYGELARSLVSDILEMPEYYTPKDDEDELVKFMEQNYALMEDSFSVKLQQAIEPLYELEQYAPGVEQRSKISELLHATLLGRLRVLLGSILHRRNRVAILVDNLDKAWRSDDMVVLSDLIFGLLSVCSRIVEDFRQERMHRRSVDFSLAIFLRTDIFARIQEQSEERDKLSFSRIAWNDSELLLRVVNNRLVSSLDERYSPEQIWRSFITPKVNGVRTQDFFVGEIMPRPRDAINFMNIAIAEAVDRGHTRIEEDDFISAIDKYSQLAFQSLFSEDNPAKGKLETILYEFAGASRTLLRSEVEERLAKAGLSAKDVAYYLDLLCDLSFLGIETRKHTYEYPADEGRRKVLRKAAQSRGQSEETYEVNRPFRAFLEIAG